MNPLNILLWSDGFWCFKEELCPHFLRDDDYREIVHGDAEWLHLSTARQTRSMPAAAEPAQDR